MAQSTLQEMAREVYLYSAEVAPLPLCQRFIRDRYRKICDRVLWSFKLGRGTFQTPDAYSTGTVTMTNSSAIVAGSGTAWTSTLIGQQLKVNGLVFTITAVGSTTSLTIDQSWYGSTTSGLTYIICQAYITPTPTDFHGWYSVIDPVSSWKLRLGMNSSEIDRIDARRSATGTPYVLCNGVYNTASTPYMVYELWPSPLSIKQYMYTYERRIPDLTAPTDTPYAIIRSDILVKGALADLARWPGTPERKNPMWDTMLINWRSREAEFEAEVQKQIVEDQTIMQNDLSFGRDFRYAPIDANFMQSHSFPSY
jgi:hypothetical protein